MGLTWSKRNRHHHQRLSPSSPSSETSSPTTTLSTPLPLPPPPPPLPPPRSSSTLNSINPPPPPPPQPRPAQIQPPSYAFAANAPHPTFPPPPEQHSYHPYPPRQPPPPPLPPFSHNNYSYNFSNHYCRPTGQFSNYRPYYMPQINGWGQSVGHYPPPLPPPPPPPPPVPYVDHQSAKKVKNDVNVHKDTIRLQLDAHNEDCHLVSFTFDALVDGSITIFYFAKEGPHCSFTPVYPEIEPVKFPFQKGLGQKFYQLSGTGVDLGFFDTDDLSKPFPGEDVYPLVILAESCGSKTEQSNQELINASRHAQISQAVLEKDNDGNFQVKVMKQILWIDGVRYELREIFGISESNETTFSGMDLGKECVICMTDDKNTAVLPCRHLCMCSGCAKELRLQSNKCPICRQPIEELLEIKVDEGNNEVRV